MKAVVSVRIDLDRPITKKLLRQFIEQALVSGYLPDDVGAIRNAIVKVRARDVDLD